MVFGSVSSLLRTLVVGTLAYVALVLLLRLSGKRTLSKWNAFDLVVTVAFGSTMATALLSMDNSLVQIVLAFAVLIGLQWIVTWVSVHYITAERWVKSEPRLLLRQGRLIRENLLQERVTEKEIRSAVRSEGMMALEDVEAVILETNGVFSVIKKRGSSATALADVRGYSDAP
ncbi:MAG: YetF domain-containing protein [Desulfosarcina sp.]